MAVGKAEHQFIAHVEVGAGAAGVSGAGSTVRIELDGAADVDVDVAVHEPGDVKALDAAAVTRMVPRPEAGDFEPNLFAAIEVAHPALPWMVSPAMSPALPWMVLVVVEDGPGVVMSASVLTLTAPASVARELVDLRDAWAWVHAHGVGLAGGAIAPQAYAHSREPTFARLMCPRRLAPRTRYHAALVPVFARGAQAGLGDPVTAGPTELAWNDATVLPLRLPVYHHWSFSTGEGGDFMSLARRLVPRAVAVARSTIDAAEPGWGVPAAAGRAVVVGGALEPADVAPIVQSPEAVELGRVIGTMFEGPPTGLTLDPPMYGSFATGLATLTGAPAWIRRVNTDVRLRIAAGLGAEVVRRNQEAFVDAAWQELGDAEAANQLLRQSRLSAAITERLRVRHLDGIESDAELLHVARPAHRRFRITDAEGAFTIGEEIERSTLPTRGATAAFRRLTRPGARLGRRAGTPLAGPLVARANVEEIRAAPPKRLPDGIAPFDAISEAEHIQPRFSSARPEAIDESATFWKRPELAPPPGELRLLARRRTSIPDGEEDWSPVPISEVPDPDPVEVDEFAGASRAHQRYLVAHLGARPVLTPRRPFGRGTLRPLRTRLTAAMAPRAALLPRVASQILGHSAQPDAPLEPIPLPPVLERPMLPELRAIELGHVVPGIADIPADTVAMLEPDHEAIWSFLVGVNHELASELVWRGYPGPSNATPVRNFWGRLERNAAQLVRLAADIPPINEWPASGPTPPGVGLTLLLRGELVRRYPNAIVYLVEARWQSRFRVVGTGAQRPPLFQIPLGGDTAIYGFDLTPEVARGGARPGPPGWYVIIEEHPQEPRFGLAAADAAGPLPTWGDLAWGHVTDADLHGGSHLRVAGPLAALHPDTAAGLTWGSDSAQQAAITLRRPTRIAIHASLLLRPQAVLTPPNP